jgi:hypothetical protein
MGSTGSRRTLFLFAGVSLAAIFAGSAIMALIGLPHGSWLRNPAAWLLGMALAAGLLVGGRSPLLPKALLGAAILGLAATFLAAGSEGVHRWVDIGPLQVNVAALLLAPAVVALAFVGIWSRTGLAASLAIGDASDPAAGCLAGCRLCGRRPAPCLQEPGQIAGQDRRDRRRPACRRSRMGPPRSVEPILEVEEILWAAWAASPLLASLAALSLAAVTAAPLRSAPPPGGGPERERLALAAYMATISLAPAFGAFPHSHSWFGHELRDWILAGDRAPLRTNLDDPGSSAADA